MMERRGGQSMVRQSDRPRQRPQAPVGVVRGFTSERFEIFGFRETRPVPDKKRYSDAAPRNMELTFPPSS